MKLTLRGVRRKWRKYGPLRKMKWGNRPCVYYSQRPHSIVNLWEIYCLSWVQGLEISLVVWCVPLGFRFTLPSSSFHHHHHFIKIISIKQIYKFIQPAYSRANRGGYWRYTFLLRSHLSIFLRNSSERSSRLLRFYVRGSKNNSCYEKKTMQREMQSAINRAYWLANVSWKSRKSVDGRILNKARVSSSSLPTIVSVICWTRNTTTTFVKRWKPRIMEKGSRGKSGNMDETVHLPSRNLPITILHLRRNERFTTCTIP